MENEGVRKTGVGKMILAVLLLVSIILSMTVVSKMASDPEWYEQTLTDLNRKETTVLALTTASVAASTAIAAVPGDTTTPIADEIADVTSYFVIILAIIFIEKYMVTIFGYAAFMFVIPAACVMLLAWLFSKKNFLFRWGVKFLALGIIVWAVIPISSHVSMLIERTSQVNYESAIEEAQQITDDINENTDENGNAISNFLNKIKGGISSLAERGKALFVHFLESIAVLLATSCVIPVAVVLLMIWVIKLVFGMQIKAPVPLTGKVACQHHRHGHPDDTDGTADE